MLNVFFGFGCFNCSKIQNCNGATFVFVGKSAGCTLHAKYCKPKSANKV